MLYNVYGLKIIKRYSVYCYKGYYDRHLRRFIREKKQRINSMEEYKLSDCKESPEIITEEEIVDTVFLKTMEKNYEYKVGDNISINEILYTVIDVRNIHNVLNEKNIYLAYKEVIREDGKEKARKLINKINVSIGSLSRFCITMENLEPEPKKKSFFQRFVDSFKRY